MLGSKTITLEPGAGADATALAVGEPVPALNNSASSSRAASRTVLKRTRTMQASSPSSGPGDNDHDRIEPAISSTVNLLRTRPRSSYRVGIRTRPSPGARDRRPPVAHRTQEVWRETLGEADLRALE